MQEEEARWRTRVEAGTKVRDFRTSKDVVGGKHSEWALHSYSLGSDRRKVGRTKISICKRIRSWIL